MNYKLGAPLGENEIYPGRIIYSSFWKPDKILEAPAIDNALIEIKHVAKGRLRTYDYTFSLLGESKIQEGDFGVAWFYEAVPATA